MIVKQSLYSAGFIVLIAGTCVGAPLAQLVRGERPDSLILLFILTTHAFAVPMVRRVWVGNNSDPNDRMVMAVTILGYLAGIGCGIALIVT